MELPSLQSHLASLAERKVGDAAGLAIDDAVLDAIRAKVPFKNVGQSTMWNEASR